MSSRDKILNDIKNNQPEYLPLSSWSWETSENVVETFTNTLKGIGGNVVVVPDVDAVRKDIVQTHGEHDGSKESLEKIDVAVLEGQLGVAENGAVWVDENSLTHRVLPFICQHLVIILNERSIVANMHQAYERIDVSKPGFGVFIAGPSKTADIEQSLVIGAHGARSTTVYLVRG